MTSVEQSLSCVLYHNGLTQSTISSPLLSPISTHPPSHIPPLTTPPHYPPSYSPHSIHPLALSDNSHHRAVDSTSRPSSSKRQSGMGAGSRPLSSRSIASHKSSATVSTLSKHPIYVPCLSTYLLNTLCQCQCTSTKTMSTYPILRLCAIFF